MKELEVREAIVRDAVKIAEIYNYYVLNTHVTFDTDPVSPQSRAEWISLYNRNRMHRLFVGTVEDQVIGYTSSSSFRPKPAYYRSVETTIYLDPKAVGKNWGTALYKHLLDQLTNTEVKKCYGIIALPNKASVKLHVNLDYREVGLLTEVGFKFNQFWDTLWMERTMKG